MQRCTCKGAAAELSVIVTKKQPRLNGTVQINYRNLYCNQILLFDQDKVGFVCAHRQQCLQGQQCYNEVKGGG